MTCLTSYLPQSMASSFSDMKGKAVGAINCLRKFCFANQPCCLQNLEVCIPFAKALRLTGLKRALNGYGIDHIRLT